MIAYEYFRSSAAYRLRIALNLKQLNPERRYVQLLSGEQRAPDYRAINPQGLVPYLADGEFGLSQSLAIIEYLDETHPEPPLLPASPRDRAWVRSVALLIACDIHPLNNLRVLNYLADPLQQSEDTRNRWYCHWIQEGFVALEEMLLQRKVQTPFCLGDSPTLADICLVPQVANAQRFKCPLEAFPTLLGIYHHAMKLPAFDAAQPSRQPDCPKPAGTAS